MPLLNKNITKVTTELHFPVETPTEFTGCNYEFYEDINFLQVGIL